MATSTIKPARLRSLFDRLAAAGLTRSYVRRVAFPSWWKDSLAEDEGGYGRALGFIHHHLGIPLESLWQDKKAITCPEHEHVNFKKAKNLSAKDVRWARCIGVAAAGIAIEAMPPQKVKGPKTGSIVRDAIMAHEHAHVDLDNLLEYIWGLGIPVLHIDEYPGKKMAALAVRMNDRPAIVLCTNHTKPAKMLFDLAHELGHILLKHVGAEGVLVDAEISRNTGVDAQEHEANCFALDLILGDSERIYSTDTDLSPRKLAEWCSDEGERDGILPGVIAQQHAHHTGEHAIAATACKLLGGDDAATTVRCKMIEKLDFENLSEEDGEFLLKVAGKGALDAEPAGH